MIFNVDGSESIRARGWIQMKDFIVSVVDTFVIGPDDTRIGLVTYGNTLGDVIELDEYSQRGPLLSRILSLSQPMQGTFAHLALRRTRDMFLRARDNVQKVVVIVTDGRSHDKQLTLAETDELKRQGVLIFVVAIGLPEDLDPEELRLMASDPSLNFTVGDFSALSRIVDQLKESICVSKSDHILY